MLLGFPKKTIFYHDPTSLLRLVIALIVSQGFVYRTSALSPILNNGLVSNAANPTATILDLAISLSFVLEPLIQLGEKVSTLNPLIWKALCKESRISSQKRTCSAVQCSLLAKYSSKDYPTNSLNMGQAPHS